MKKLILLIILLFSFSGFAQADHQVINDFLETELEDFKYDSIYVQIEPISTSEVLKIYKLAYIEKDLQNASSAQVWINPEITEWPFDEKEISEIEKNIRSDAMKWGGNDFRNKDYVFKNEVLLNDRKFVVSHLDASKKEYVLRLSRPIFNDNRTFVMFKYDFTEFFMGSNPTANRGVIIMKKQKNEWIFISAIRQAIYR